MELGHLTAGSYSQTEKAIYWDGKTVYENQKNGDPEISPNPHLNHYPSCCVKARGIFCWLEIGLGINVMKNDR
jgi:hypothetical protein